MKDPADLSRGLLRKAQQDLIAMEAVLAARALDAACFHAQQAAEKCLKAFLAYKNLAFPYTHNLTKLVEICIESDATFGALLPAVAPLTPYAVELRYDDSFWPTETVAQEAHDSARQVMQFVLAKLPPDIRRAIV